MSPAHRKVKQPGLDAVLVHLGRQHAAVLRARSHTQKAEAARASTAQRALELGATMREVGEVLGMSPAGVKKMVDDVAR